MITWLINCSNRRFWSHYSCSDRPKVPSLTNWKWTKIAFWHSIIIFDNMKWIKNAFSIQLLLVIWKPPNTFRDQKIRSYVEVKNKIWKTWFLFHFVQNDSRWEEEITQEDHHSWFEENGGKYWNFWKFQKFSGGPLYLFPPLSL